MRIHRRAGGGEVAVVTRANLDAALAGGEYLRICCDGSSICGDDAVIIRVGAGALGKVNFSGLTMLRGDAMEARKTLPPHRDLEKTARKFTVNVDGRIGCADSEGRERSLRIVPQRNAPPERTVERPLAAKGVCLEYLCRVVEALWILSHEDRDATITLVVGADGIEFKTINAATGQEISACIGGSESV